MKLEVAVSVLARWIGHPLGSNFSGEQQMFKCMIVGLVVVGATCGCVLEPVRRTILIESCIGLLAGILMAAVCYIDAQSKLEQQPNEATGKLVFNEVAHAFVGGFLIGLILGLLELFLE